MKKTWIALPVAAVVALGMVACDSNPAGLAPEGPSRELVDINDRITDVNAWVYGSFILPIGGDGERQPILVENGESNFPGHPKNKGSCVDGTWLNPKGQPTGGNRTSPHPHCIAGWTQAPAMEVILEPISANFVSSPQFRIRLAQGTGDNYRIQINTQGNLEAAGTIVAYAVRADNMERVGEIEIDLGQYSGKSSDALLECNVDEVFGDEPTGCVKYLIDFTFTPDGGQPIAFTEEGFLWWVTGKTAAFRTN
jgi:hypothetical protein